MNKRRLVEIWDRLELELRKAARSAGETKLLSYSPHFALGGSMVHLAYFDCNNSPEYRHGMLMVTTNMCEHSPGEGEG